MQGSLYESLPRCGKLNALGKTSAHLTCVGHQLNQSRLMHSQLYDVDLTSSDARNNWSKFSPVCLFDTKLKGG